MRIRGSGKGALRIAIEDFLETYDLGKILSNWVLKIGESFEKAIAIDFSDILNQIADTEGVPEEIRKRFKDRELLRAQGGIASLVGFGTQLGSSAASAFMSPIMRLINYTVDNKLRSARFDPATAWAAIWRHPRMMEELKDHMRQLGWGETEINLLGELFQNRLGVADLINYWLRNPWYEETLDNELRMRGFTKETIDQLKELAHIIPPVNDLISMAVREAWDEETIARFEYDKEIPKEAQEWAEKQGLDPEWFRRYWIAHWRLPGVRDAFEMLHRLRPKRTENPFTKEDMRRLLKAADYPRFWRDRLIEISYSPYTRVDVRRMYRLGVLSPEEVKYAYMDLGYDEEHAEKLTEFTIKYETGEQRELTRSAIISGYKRGLFSRSQAKETLINIGYPEDNAEFFLDMADYDLAKERIDAQLEEIEYLYVEGEISDVEVYERVGKLNLPAQQIAILISEWNVKKAKKIQLPTRRDLEDFYRRDLITINELRQGLKKRHYPDHYIDLYIKRLDQVLAEEAAKEAERAQKEQERLEKAKRATAYMKQKAELDVQIAQARVAIADLKVALHFVETPDQANEILKQIDFIKRQIAELQMQKAQIRLEVL